MNQRIQELGFAEGLKALLVMLVFTLLEDTYQKVVMLWIHDPALLESTLELIKYACPAEGILILLLFSKKSIRKECLATKEQYRERNLYPDLTLGYWSFLAALVIFKESFLFSSSIFNHPILFEILEMIGIDLLLVAIFLLMTGFLRKHQELMKEEHPEKDDFQDGDASDEDIDYDSFFDMSILEHIWSCFEEPKPVFNGILIFLLSLFFRILPEKRHVENGIVFSVTGIWLFMAVSLVFALMYVVVAKHIYSEIKHRKSKSSNKGRSDL